MSLGGGFFACVDVFAEFVFEHTLMLNAYGAPDGLSVFEKNQSGHRLYAISGGEFLITVDVHLYDVGGITYC